MKIYTILFSAIITIFLSQSCNWDEDSFNNGFTYYSSLEGIWGMKECYSYSSDSANPTIRNVIEDYAFDDYYIQFDKEGNFKQLRGYDESRGWLETSLSFSGFTYDYGMYMVDRDGVILLNYEIGNSVIFYIRKLTKDSIIVVERDANNHEIDSMCLARVNVPKFDTISYIGCWQIYSIVECESKKRQADTNYLSSYYKNKFLRFMDNGAFRFYKYSDDRDSLVFMGSEADYGTYTVDDGGSFTLDFANGESLTRRFNLIEHSKMKYFYVDSTTGHYIFYSLSPCQDPVYTDPSLDGIWQFPMGAEYNVYSYNYLNLKSDNTFERYVGLDEKNIMYLGSYDSNGPEYGTYTYTNDTLILTSGVSECPGTWKYKYALTASELTLSATTSAGTEYSFVTTKTSGVTKYDKSAEFKLINRTWKCTSCKFLAVNSDEKVDAMDDYGMSDYTITYNATTTVETGSSVPKRIVNWYFYSSSYITYDTYNWDETSQSYVEETPKVQRMTEELTATSLKQHYYDSNRKGTVYLEFVPVE